MEYIIMQVAKFIVFSGDVQGIGFRYTAHRVAGRYSLTGYVRNTPDGSVELLLQGHPDDISAYIADIKETFSRYIRNVDIEDTPFNPEYDSFMIRL
jgi:acylphosphatase